MSFDKAKVHDGIFRVHGFDNAKTKFIFDGFDKAKEYREDLKSRSE